MKALILAKLKEGSTWAGIGTIVASLGFAHSAEVGALFPTIGALVSGVLAIYFQ